MSSDERVVVPVEMTLADVKRQAEFNDPVGIACRAWLADNPEQEQEREVFRLDHYDDMGYRIVRRAVPVEALRPGDRVAGRVVELVRWVDFYRDGAEGLEVRWKGWVGSSGFQPGTLILLDPEDGER